MARGYERFRLEDAWWRGRSSHAVLPASEANGPKLHQQCRADIDLIEETALLAMASETMADLVARLQNLYNLTGGAVLLDTIAALTTQAQALTAAERNTFHCICEEPPAGREPRCPVCGGRRVFYSRSTEDGDSMACATRKDAPSGVAPAAKASIESPAQLRQALTAKDAEIRALQETARANGEAVKSMFVGSGVLRRALDKAEAEIKALREACAEAIGWLEYDEDAQGEPILDRLRAALTAQREAQ